MHIGEPLQECLHGSIIQALLTLINLENLLAALHVIPTDGERNDELDAIVLAELGKWSHLLGIKRTEDKVALAGTLLQQSGTDIRIDRHIPGMNIGRNTVLLQIVTCHQDATVILHHALAVAIHIMQRQHHANLHGVADGSCRLGSSRSNRFLAGSRSSGSCLLVWILLSLGIRDKQGGSFLEHVSLLLHLRIGIHEFRKRQSITAGDTEDGIFLLHRIDVAPLGGLSENTDAEHQPNDNKEISLDSSHNFINFIFLSFGFLQILSHFSADNLQISMFSFAKIQKILHSAQNLSAFYYLCTNNSSNETKNKYTLHLVATFNVPIARSGSQRWRRGQPGRDTTGQLSSHAECLLTKRRRHQRHLQTQERIPEHH